MSECPSNADGIPVGDAHSQIQYYLPTDYIFVHTVLRSWTMRVRHMQLY